MVRTTEIKLTVDLDDENLPTAIQWQASEGQPEGPSESQAMMLSLWDGKSGSTAAIDLWVKGVTIEEMNQYFYQVIHKMADTYSRATRNVDVAESIREFGNEFGESLGLVKRKQE